MSERYSRIIVILVAALALAAIACATPAQAIEYSAVMVMRSAPTASGLAKSKARTAARIYVKGAKVRDEALGGRMPQTTILRPDKGIVWAIWPSTKTYMEMKYKGPSEGTPFHIPLEAIKQKKGAKRIGTENYNGYVCDKYRLTVKQANQTITDTLLISRKLNCAVRIDVRTSGGPGTMTMELVNIQEKPQPDSLFELPKGFKKGTPPMPPPGRPGAPPPQHMHK